MSCYAFGMDLCENALLPIEAPENVSAYPTPNEAKEFLPGTSYSHVFISGYALVEFIINPNGSVHNPKVIEAQYEPVGKSIHKPDYFRGFYNSSAPRAALQYRYAPQSKPCVYQLKFTYEQPKT